jgi:hypothetical protein
VGAELLIVSINTAVSVFCTFYAYYDDMACYGRRLRQAGLNRPMEIRMDEDSTVWRRAQEGQRSFVRRQELAADGIFEAEPGNKHGKHKCKYSGL